jgi:alkaline phosphatase D
MLNRREFLWSALALSATPVRQLLDAAPALAIPTRSPRWAPQLQNPRFPTSPFTLGVASGDPSDDSVVLWTRLAIDALRGGGMPPQPVEVEWHLASDDRMTRVVKKGKTIASPQWGHSVHIEVSGLDPHRWYWYQFRAGNEQSAIGRTRTFPRSRDDVDRLRFAIASCQHYEQGLYTAYEHMVREDLDLVVHLGDYIYENPGIDQRVRKHVGGELTTVEDYRNRYAQYRSDPALQAAHAAFPWLLVWDDHEVDNNYAGFFQETGDPIETFALRRAAAYKVYYEHMPLRRSSLPRGAFLQLYRPFSYGTLANIFMLDTRQFRTDQPCGDGVKPVCDSVRDPKATLLGQAQERWLLNGLNRSRAGWNLLAQQIPIARLDRMPGPERQYSMDKWDGYGAERSRLLNFLGTRRPSNPVTLAGDVHNNWVNDLRLNVDDPTTPIVASEFVGTSISSTGDGSDISPAMEAMLSENECVRFCNNQRGYVSFEVRPETLRADFRVVEYVSRPGSPIKTRASFVVENGRPGAQKA